MFDTFFARRRLRLLITAAAGALESGKFNLDALVRELAQTREDLALIRSYISIITAARLTAPLTGPDVDGAFERLRASERHLDQPGFEEILDIHRELAEYYWNKACQAIRHPMKTAEEDAEMAERIGALENRLEVLLGGL